MERFKRCILGKHTQQEIRWHLAALAVIYWALVFFAYLGYTSQHAYSIHNEMLSALGSFDEGHNPQWFWVFSIAMVYCGLIMTPIMFYVYRRFYAVSPWAATVGAVFFLAGCAGIFFTGLFPYGHGTAIANWEWRHLHMKSAGTIAFGFSLGLFWHFVLLLKDKYGKGLLSVGGAISYAKLAGPFFVCVPLLAVIGYKTEWAAVFAGLQDVFSGAPAQAVHDFDAAFGRLKGFALLEHLSIWALTIFVIWFTAVLPHRLERECSEIEYD